MGFVRQEPSCGLLGYLAASFTFCPSSFIFSPAWCAVSLSFQLVCRLLQCLGPLSDAPFYLVFCRAHDVFSCWWLRREWTGLEDQHGFRRSCSQASARFEPNSVRPRRTLLPCISQHHMHCEARAGVLHSYIRNVPQASRAVCEHPAKKYWNLAKIVQVETAKRTHSVPRSAVSVQPSDGEPRARDKPLTRWICTAATGGALAAGGPFPAAPLATDAVLAGWIGRRRAAHHARLVWSR